MSQRQENELVERLNRRKSRDSNSSYREETFSYRPTINKTSRSVSRKGNVFHNLNNDVKLRQSKIDKKKQEQ